MNYSAIIIDDERLARLALKKDLEKFPEITILGEATGIATAKPLIEQIKPNLIFLDIQLTDGTGFDLLNQVEYSGKVIFVTAYDKYAFRAFEVNAIDYLLKPISLKRLKSAIDKLSKNGDQDQVQSTLIKLNYDDRLMVMHRNIVNFIKINSISAICASREYSYIRTTDGKEYLTSNNISQWENRLPDQNFCRIHRSTIINFDHIVKISHNISGTGEVVLQGSFQLYNISRNYFKKIKQRYSL
jgi:two-component system, LytTR family, response regulator